MMDLIYFLGRFHVLVLHLPIGILLVAVVLEALAWFRRDERLASITPLIWGIGAASAVLTVALGWMHAMEAGFDGPDVANHRWWGVSVAVLAIGIWAAKLAPAFPWRRWAVAGGGILISLGLFITGHYGGNLTHGETYLVEYAPAPIRALAGIEVREAVTDVASADPYRDIVAPVLEMRCQGCHNESKRRGELSLVSYEALAAGGESGPSFAPGNPDASELYRRITLPKNHTDFMPAKGKTPLSDEQVQAIEWWIRVGAPKQGTVTDFEPSDDIRVALQRVLGLEEAASVASVSKAAVPTASDAAIAALQAMGARVRPMTQQSPFLDVDFSTAAPVRAEAINALAAVREQVARLNLRGANLSDYLLSELPAFPNVTDVNLAENPLTDAAAASLKQYPQLTVLNLYGTQLSDLGIGQLANIASLKRIYVWRTQVTAAGVAALASKHPEIVIIADAAVISNGG
jgi:uncharacterized membrane protein/mono/diheme cytochrome c family protein